MTRTFIQHSIDDLELEYSSALQREDISKLQEILNELSFRKTSRARELHKVVELDIAKLSAASPIELSPRPHRPLPEQQPKTTKKKIDFSPTNEQTEALENFLTGRTLKINAYAGSGKTSTLQLLSNNTSKAGQYIAFNRSIVSDAKRKFPSSVNCSTIHSLAFRSTHSDFKRDINKLTGKISSTQLAELLHLKRWRIDNDHTLEPISQAYLILQTARRFMQSDATEPERTHVPIHGALITASEETRNAVSDFCLRGCKYVWDKMLDPTDLMPLGHDGYLKLWALSEPKIAADFIMLDEAQDTNPVVLDLLKRQSAQMIYVGDKYQQIYEWRGAINAMERIETANSSFLTTSFRFGPAIADAANVVLALLGEHRPIQGNARINSMVGPGQARTVLARTNASTLAEVISCLDNNQKPHLVGDINELVDMLKGVEDLKQGKPCLTVPDFFGFTNWTEVVDFSKTSEGEHLLTFVNLVLSKGERQLLWALKRTVAEEQADVVISTAHKAKGREWDAVRLNDDFIKGLSRKPDKPIDPAELRLFYVAMTRGRKLVEIPPSVMSILGIVPTSLWRTEQMELAPILLAPKKERTPDSPPNVKTLGVRPPAAERAWQPPPDFKPADASAPAQKVMHDRLEQDEISKPQKSSLWSWLRRQFR